MGRKYHIRAELIKALNILRNIRSCSYIDSETVEYDGNKYVIFSVKVRVDEEKPTIEELATIIDLTRRGRISWD